MSVKDHLEATRADITALAVDAIVNAANAQLLPGGGVDGAIRRAAGPSLTEETTRIGRCPTGTAVITKGYGLPAKHVIHTAAPIWEAGYRDAEQDRLLASCYTSVLKLADEHGIRTIAFPPSAQAFTAGRRNARRTSPSMPSFGICKMGASRRARSSAVSAMRTGRATGVSSTR